jgi:hypothetical protein
LAHLYLGCIAVTAERLSFILVFFLLGSERIDPGADCGAGGRAKATSDGDTFCCSPGSTGKRAHTWGHRRTGSATSDSSEQPATDRPNGASHRGATESPVCSVRE